MAEAATLTDVIMVLRENNEEQSGYQLEIWSELQNISSMFADFFAEMKIIAMDRLEQDRENMKPLREKYEPQGGKDLEPISIPTGLLLGGIAALLGSITGYVGKIAEGFKLLSADLKIAKLLEPIGKWFETATKSIKRGLRKEYIKFLRSWRAFTAGISNFFGIADGLQDISKGMKELGLTKMFEFGTKIKGVFAPITKFFGGVFRVFQGIGKIAVPIEALVRSVLNIMDETDKLAKDASNWDWAGAILKGITKGLGQVITSFMDFFKDIVSWAAEKMGFGEFSKELDSLNFTDMFNKGVDAISKMISDAIEWIAKNVTWDKISKGVGDLATGFTESFKALLRSILPDPSAPITTIEGIGKYLIPDAVYDWVGMNKTTGELTRDAQMTRDLNEQKLINERINRLRQTNAQMIQTSTVVDERGNIIERGADISKIESSQAFKENIKEIQRLESGGPLEKDPLQQAINSGLYNKNGVMQESIVNPSKIKEASTEQLQAILNDNDVSESTASMLKTEINNRSSSTPFYLSPANTRVSSSNSLINSTTENNELKTTSTNKSPVVFAPNTSTTSNNSNVTNMISQGMSGTVDKFDRASSW